MKKNTFLCALITAFCLLFRVFSFSQCQPYIQIDGMSSSPTGLPLPIWLHAGQTLGMNTSVSSISIIEFNVNGTALEFSQVMFISSLDTVPANKVWKIESVIKAPMTGTVLSSRTYTTAGANTFSVPSCTNYICIEVWGGGGGGGGGYNPTNQNGGGGGGGSYGAGCFSVTPGSTINLTVGVGGTAGAPLTQGGTGGTTSVGSLISAGGGFGGFSSTGLGGTFGTSTAIINLPGSSGTNGGTGGCVAGYGGAGANGGGGGSPGCNTGGTGGFPGGGGGGGNMNGGSPYYGGAGGTGQVKITW